MHNAYSSTLHPEWPSLLRLTKACEGWKQRMQAEYFRAADADVLQQTSQHRASSLQSNVVRSTARGLK